MQIRLEPTRLLPCLLAVLVVMTMPALGRAKREKSDVIILKNGNRVSGEIKKLDQGMLTLKTDSMSTVEIKWEDIVGATSNFKFRIEDTTGRVYYGALGASPEEHSLQIIGPGSTEQVALQSVVRMTGFDERIWDRFSGSLSLGFSFTKANTSTQFNVAADVLYQSRQWEYSGSYSSVLSRFQGVTQADVWTGSLGGQRFLGKKWFTFSRGLLEHNSELDLDRRSSLLGGMGRYLIQTNRGNLRLGGGLIYSHENYSSAPGRNNAEGVITTNARIFRLHSPKVDVQTDFLVMPSISNAGRVRTQLNVGANLELFIRDFFWNMSFYDSFDSRPPQENPTRNDYGIVTGISWSFRR